MLFHPANVPLKVFSILFKVHWACCAKYNSLRGYLGINIGNLAQGDIVMFLNGIKKKDLQPLEFQVTLEDEN